MSTTHSSFDQYRPTALVTELLVIEQLLHPAPKSIVSAPWHNFNLCPSSQQILATPMTRPTAAAANTCIRRRSNRWCCRQPCAAGRTGRTACTPVRTWRIPVRVYWPRVGRVLPMTRSARRSAYRSLRAPSSRTVACLAMSRRSAIPCLYHIGHWRFNQSNNNY